MYFQFNELSVFWFALLADVEVAVFPSPAPPNHHVRDQDPAQGHVQGHDRDQSHREKKRAAKRNATSKA